MLPPYIKYRNIIKQFWMSSSSDIVEPLLSLYLYREYLKLCTHHSVCFVLFYLQNIYLRLSCDMHATINFYYHNNQWDKHANNKLADCNINTLQQHNPISQKVLTEMHLYRCMYWSKYLAGPLCRWVLTVVHLQI